MDFSQTQEVLDVFQAGNNVSFGMKEIALNLDYIFEAYVIGNRELK